jgi:hypothetical protein
MDNNMGWVKIYRQIENWEWYKTPNMAHLFQHLIMKANHETQNWQGITIERGQLVTGRKALKAQTGLSEQSVRTCLNKLKSTGEITIKTTSRFSVITICNYGTYQDQQPTINQEINQQSNQQLTNNQPTTNHKQECKELKNDKEDKNTIIKGFESFWKAYPKKVGKGKCEEWWVKHKPDALLLAKMLSAVEKQRLWEQWTKKDGQFIPMPATWLNQKRWEDEGVVGVTTEKEGKYKAMQEAVDKLFEEKANAQKANK